MSDQYIPMIERISEEYDESDSNMVLELADTDQGYAALKQQMSELKHQYVTNADAGCGLIRYGSALVPFINRFPRDTRLYALMTTKPGEGVFGGEEVPA